MAKDSAKFPDIGERLVRIRQYFGYPEHGDGKRFAKDHGFTEKQWNHWERGHSIPWQQAKKLTDHYPAVTLDYIYRNRLDGLPFAMLKAFRKPLPRK